MTIWLPLGASDPRLRARGTPSRRFNWPEQHGLDRLFSNEDGYPALNAVGDESFNLELDFREDQRLLFEGIIGRFTGFDGNVLVTLELRNQTDEVLSSPR